MKITRISHHCGAKAEYVILVLDKRSLCQTPIAWTPHRDFELGSFAELTTVRSDSYGRRSVTKSEQPTCPSCYLIVPGALRSLPEPLARNA